MASSKNNRKKRRAREAALNNARAARERALQEKALRNGAAADAAAAEIEAAVDKASGRKPKAEAAAQEAAVRDTAAQAAAQAAPAGRGGRRIFRGSLAAVLVFALVLAAVIPAAVAIRRENVRRSEMNELLENMEAEPIPEEEIAALEEAERAAAEQAAKEAAEKAAAEEKARLEAEEAARAEAARLAEEERIRNLPKRIVFIGDSRTVQLQRAVDYDKDFCYFSAESSMGYDWMRSTGVPQADGWITDKTAVVINMGVNDLANAERYAAYVNELAVNWTQRGAKLWYMSVNPVGEHASVTNEQISEFNSTMQEELESGIGWIDTNSLLWQQGFTAGDSLHYDEKTYQKIYDCVFRTLGLTQ